MKKKIQKPFNTEAWKNGARVETRDGRPVRILCTDVKCMYGYSIVAVIIDGEYEHVHTFTEKGAYNDGCEDEFDLVIVEEVEEPERWADDKDAKGEGWFYSGREFCSDSFPLNEEIYYDVFATEKQAKSALAMARISQLMANDKRYGGVVTDEEWANEELIKYVLRRYNNRVEYDKKQCTYYFLAFHTAKQCELFLAENERLVKDYLMID